MEYLKVVAEKTGNEGKYGILKDNEIHFLNDSPLSENSFETGDRCKLDEIKKFLPPIEPPNIIALGLNYRGHAKESSMELPPAPVIFLKATSAITGHLQPIILPGEVPDKVDYEAELVIVIGKNAKNIKPEEAENYILGYTCGNDVSARDCQLEIDKQWARGKSFDTFAPIGPWIETAVDSSHLKIQSRLNGKVMQEATTGDLIFSIPEIVSYLSKQMTLLPGTIIMTGTPEGVGFAKNPPVFLREGDIVEIEIEGIGILKNYVEKEK